MSTNVTPVPAMAEKLEKALIGGDLAPLSAQEKVQYYNSVCQSLGLNPLTKPFAYLKLNGKEILYALKDCTEQLRNIHAISLTIPARELMDDVYVVTARASRPDGRVDESTGAVTVGGIKGEAKANAMMKAETKAKRRVTLSICGLGMLDETEVETIPSALPTKEEKQQARAEGHAAQQAVAARKVEQLQSGQPVESWDWRIALPRFEALEQKYGKTEVSIALKMAGFNSLEETPSREAALTAYEKVRTTLAKAATEQPAWVDKPSAKPESKLEKAADPLQRMLERMDNFKGRLAVIQQHKFDLVQKYGQKEGEQRYYDVLDKHSGHNDTHANEIARHADKSRAVASELWLELHPEAVEEEVGA